MENKKKIEKLSRVISLSVFDIFSDTDTIIPAYFIANLMSEDIWSNYLKKRLHPHQPSGELKALNTRTNDLQKYMNKYEFTTMENCSGGDPWGLVSFEKEARRFGEEFIKKLRIDIEASLRHIENHNPQNQFAKILNESFYKDGYYPRYRNETVEVMNAFGHIRGDKKGSGKCIALIMAAMSTAIAYFKIPSENICIIGSKGHIMAFIELEDRYCIWNNRLKYANNTTEKFKSDIIPKLDEVNQDYFFYPAFGICNFEKKVSNVSEDRVRKTINNLKQFIGIEIKVQEYNTMSWVKNEVHPIPNPIDFKDVSEYRKKIYDLAKDFPFSIYDYSKYAYREIHVDYPQAYIIAAERDSKMSEIAKKIRTFEDAFDVLKGIRSCESIFKSRDRIALPDEVLLFNKGNDRDRALLLYSLLSNIRKASTSKSLIGFSEDASFVKCGDSWINSNTLDFSNEPTDLKIVFNENGLL